MFNIRNAVEKVLTDGDAWDGIGAYAVEIHTHRTKETKKAKKLPPNKKHKSPEQLETYEKKRDFGKTAEPVAEIITGNNNNFVVHRHHASHLHYDLRLEQDGVLKSWAVPKGMPPRPGVKRLAVQTEDHPMKYLTFHGSIPKGEYGGGDMWIYALGKYQITKEKKDGFYFKLNSKEMTGEYRIYNTKGKDYLLERVDDPQVDYVNKFIEPMLSEIREKPFQNDEYVYEIKWDGIRALISYEDGKVQIRTRNQHDVTAQFPELLDGEKSFRATNAVFDAEIVSLDATGKPIFKNVINRMMTSGETNIAKAANKLPVYCYVFDCLYLDGRSLINEPLTKRKEFLADAIRFDTPYRVSEFVDDGQSLFNAAKEHGLEGIMAKKKDSKYISGRRTDCWYKIKVRESSEVFVIGYTKGKGDRGLTFGALHIAEKVDNELHYRGKVGTGFDDATIKDILKTLQKVDTLKKPNVIGKLIDEKISVWVDPKIIAEVNYSKLTPDKMFREPVFIKLRLDLSDVKV
jgi:bifunctional non-homologous end joining protein LigD